MYDLNEIKKYPHRRLNPLTGDWILVSPQRSQRPWMGQMEKVVEEVLPKYDPQCYLCPGNLRAGGEKNSLYKETFAFTNDFSALSSDIPQNSVSVSGLIEASSEKGICRVICFSPDHNLTLAQMDTVDIKKVVDVWVDEYIGLGSKPFINYIQIFENKGSIMGCSNPHPHGQIWAQESIPDIPKREDAMQKNYYDANNEKSLLEEYMNLEVKMNERVLFSTDFFIALVPFWATWPFESMIISKRRISNISLLTEEEKLDLAKAYKKIAVMYDNLFEVSFPYSAGIHQSPTNTPDNSHWHLHVHFFPPLLRSATVKKFMVGYEMLANAQRDITPEQAAAKLRMLPEVHFKNTPDI
jgi:UDPglucose--hexose-1-phosphate uridylyltransferase